VKECFKIQFYCLEKKTVLLEIVKLFLFEIKFFFSKKIINFFSKSNLEYLFMEKTSELFKIKSILLENRFQNRYLKLNRF
jgi:hypothetical protein